jgi:putative RecB family exonuclease
MSPNERRDVEPQLPVGRGAPQGADAERTGPACHSVSSTRAYETCPRSYWHGYVDRTPTDLRVPVSWRFGSVVHRGLEAAYEHRRRTGGSGPLRDCLPAAAAALHLSCEEHAMPPGSLGEAVNVVARVLRTEDLDARDILGVEQLLATVTPDGRRVAGYADLLLRRNERTLEVRDHKVTRWARTPDELRSDLQLNLYGWLAGQMWPWIRRVIAGHHYPLLGRTVLVVLDRSMMAAAARRVVDVADRAAADVGFPPAPGPHCDWCVWRDRCPAWS